VRKNCKVLYYGSENIVDNKNERRIYISNHPTSFDLFVLMHLSESIINAFINEDAYSIPLLGLLLNGAGFLKYARGKGRETMEQAITYIEEKKPFFHSLRSGVARTRASTKPRTGGIRIAYEAKANIYPIFAMIEKGKEISRKIRGLDLKIHPYINFNQTIYFVKFCKALRYKEYAKNPLKHKDFQRLANKIQEIFKQEQQGIMKMINENKDYFSRLERIGGSEKRIVF